MEAGILAESQVLICCPERHILRLMEVNLKRQGWQVRCTTTGQVAIDQLKQELPSILVLDSEVSNPSYREVIKELRQLPGSNLVKVIVIRNDAEGDDNDGDDEIEFFLRKPFISQDMLK